MSKFKKGDVVERIKGDFRGMYVGDRAEVLDVCPNELELTKYGCGHDPEAFKLVAGEGHLTSADIEYIKGDKFELIEVEQGVCNGREVTLKDAPDEEYTRLNGWAGVFKRDNLKLVKQQSSHLHSIRYTPVFRPLSEGDKVALVDFGWGIGDHRHVKIGSVGTVIRKEGRDQVRVNFGGEYVSVCVTRCALRKIISKPEESTVFKRKTQKGVVPEYKHLSKPKTIIEQQAHANTVLRDFKRRLSSSVWVCGGAPRNWDHGRMANDIDVYFYMSGSKASFIKAALASHLGIDREDIIKLGSQCDNAYYGLNGIKFVFQVELAGQEYQFIVMESPIGTEVENVVLEAFNCDICKIAWDPINDEFHRTTDYKTDRDMKRLTYRMYKLEESNAALSMKKHLPKMMKQFPKHTVVIYQEDPTFF